MNGLMEGTENQRAWRATREQAGQQNWKVSLLVNDLLILSLSVNAISDLG